MRAEPTGHSWLAIGSRPRVASDPGGVVQSHRAGMSLYVGDQAELDSDLNVWRLGTVSGSIPLGTVVGGKKTRFTACDQKSDAGTLAANTGQLVLVCILGMVYRGTDPLTATKTQISPSPSPADIAAAFYYATPELFGGKAYSTTALADAGPDQKSFINQAFATGLPVRFSPGVYSSTAGLITNGDGQEAGGAGIRRQYSPGAQAGTLIKRRSGDGVMLKVRNSFNQTIKDLSIDGAGIGDADSHLIFDNGIYTRITNVELMRAGGTSYCLYSYQANVCNYDHLSFPDTVWSDGAAATVHSVSYGHVYFKFASVSHTAPDPHIIGGAGYTVIDKCTGGAAGAGGNIVIQDSTKVLIQDSHFESEENGVTPFRTLGNCDNIRWTGISTESAVTTTPIFEVLTGAGQLDDLGVATAARGISFKGCRITRGGSSLLPTFKLTGGAGKALNGVTLEDNIVTDNVGGFLPAGWVNVKLDGVRGFKNTGMLVDTQSASFINHDCTGGTRSDNLVVLGQAYVHTIGSNKWLTGNVTCIGDPAAHGFLAGASSPAVFVGCGVVTTDNFPANSCLVVIGDGAPAHAVAGLTAFMINGSKLGQPASTATASAVGGGVVAVETVYNENGNIVGYRPIYTNFTP